MTWFPYFWNIAVELFSIYFSTSNNIASEYNKFILRSCLYLRFQPLLLLPLPLQTEAPLPFPPGLEKPICDVSSKCNLWAQGGRLGPFFTGLAWLTKAEVTYLMFRWLTRGDLSHVPVTYQGDLSHVPVTYQRWLISCSGDLTGVTYLILPVMPESNSKE